MTAYENNSMISKPSTRMDIVSGNLERDPYTTIIAAAEKGVGVRLSADECRFIAGRPEIVNNAGRLLTEWRTLPNYSRYEISEVGDVRRDHRDLKQTPSASHHLAVTLYSDQGEQWRVGVHHIVALAFHGPAPDGKPFACHRNGRPWDNHKGNIYWGSRQDNIEDMRRHASLDSRGKSVEIGF